MRWHWSWVALGAAGALVALFHLAAANDEKGQAQPSSPARSSIRITSMQLHMSPGGVPPGWKFTVPDGDPQAGRKAFVKFECFKCHNVQREHFPALSKTATDVGPDLTGMGGGMHPPEYFAQSIIDPNAVILDEPGYTGPDGKSKMPDYTESMSVRELIDVVAYLESLKGGEAHGSSPHDSGTPPGQMRMPGSQGHGAGGAGH